MSHPIYAFASIADAPDIHLPSGQVLRLTYEYTWGTTPRHKTYVFSIPLQIHLRDYLKMRQNALQHAYHGIQRELGGSPPVLHDVNVTLISTRPLDSY